MKCLVRTSEMGLSMRSIRYFVFLFVVFSAAPLPLLGQDVGLLPELVVLADRLNDADSEAPVAEWDREDLREAAPRTIDEALLM